MLLSCIIIMCYCRVLGAELPIPWCPPKDFGYPGMMSHNRLMLLNFDSLVSKEEKEKEHKKICT